MPEMKSDSEHPVQRAARGREISQSEMSLVNGEIQGRIVSMLDNLLYELRTSRVDSFFRHKPKDRLEQFLAYREELARMTTSVVNMNIERSSGRFYRLFIELQKRVELMRPRLMDLRDELRLSEDLAAVLNLLEGMIDFRDLPASSTE